MVFERGGDGAVSAFQQRRRVSDRFGTHDRRARVHTGLADQPFNTFGFLGDALGVRVGVIQFAELAGLCIPLRRGVENIMQARILAVLAGRQRLGDALAHGELVAHDTGGILERLLGFDGAVDHALGDFVMPVLVGHVVEDFHTAVRVEVDVDIRQGHAFWVEEAFEDQTVFERVEFGDAHGVGDHGACCRTAAGPDHYAMRFRPVDVVGDDKEVAAELHLADDAALVVGLFKHFDRRIAVVAAFEAFIHMLEEQRGLIPAFGAVETRHERAVFVIVEDHVAPVGDGERIVARFGQFFEQVAHFLRGFNVIAGTVEFEPVGVVEPGAGVDAQHRVLCVAVRLMHVMGVVGGEQRGVQLLGDGEQIFGDALLDFEPVIHELDVEIVFAENILHLTGGTQGFVELPEPQSRLDDARRAA